MNEHFPDVPSRPEATPAPHLTPGFARALEARAPLTMKDSLEVVRQYAWFERSLFEIVGAWVVSVEEPAIRVCLHVSSRRHVLHAELWEDLFGGLGWVAGDPVIPLPDSVLVDFMQHFRLPDQDGTLERVVGLYRVVLPRLISTYSLHLEHSAQVADAAILRVLKLVLLEDHEEWHQGEMMLQSLLATEADVLAASRRQSELEVLAQRCGLGASAWPG